jgi:ribonuclease HI
LNRKKSVAVYTDGSCNPCHQIGSWAAILLIDDQKLVLKGKEPDTTHQRMELTAVLKALEYLEHNHLLTLPVQLYADSQYVINVEKRRARLESNSYLTKSGQPVRNADLVKKLIGYLDNSVIEFIKVAAHQKKGESVNVNREVDKIARRMIREHLRQR